MKPAYFFVMLVLAFVSCGKNGLGRPALPDQRPADFSLTFFAAESMLPISTSIRISAGESSLVQQDQQGTRTASFTVTPDELDELYRTLKKNHFESISSHPDATVDGRVRTVQVKWGSTVMEKGDDSRRRLDPEGEGRFQDIAASIQALAARKTVGKTREKSPHP